MQVNEGTSYFSAFCTRIKRIFNDEVHYAFSSAFALAPAASSDNENKETSDEDTTWYAPTSIDDGPNKKVRFSDSTKAPKES